MLFRTFAVYIKLARMPNTFFGVLGALLGLSFAAAFLAGWFMRDPGKRLKRGILSAICGALLAACVPMFQSNPVASNEAAVGFFLLLVPATLGALVVGWLAVELAKIIRWRN